MSFLIPFLSYFIINRSNKPQSLQYHHFELILVLGKIQFLNLSGQGKCNVLVLTVCTCTCILYVHAYSHSSIMYLYLLLVYCIYVCTSVACNIFTYYYIVCAYGPMPHECTHITAVIYYTVVHCHIVFSQLTISFLVFSILLKRIVPSHFPQVIYYIQLIVCVLIFVLLVIVKYNLL